MTGNNLFSAPMPALLPVLTHSPETFVVVCLSGVS